MSFSMRFQKNCMTNVHDAPHIALPLIRLAHADESDKEIGLLLPVQPLVKAVAALCHGARKAQQRPPVHRIKQCPQQRKPRPRADFFAGALEGDKALAAFARRMEHAAEQRHAHIAADIRRHRVPHRKQVDQPPLRAVVIIAEGVPDVPDGTFVQRIYLHVFSSVFLSTATAQGIRPRQSVYCAPRYPARSKKAR